MRNFILSEKRHFRETRADILDAVVAPLQLAQLRVQRDMSETSVPPAP